MSDRLELSGFHLEKLQSLFGSRQLPVIDGIEALLGREAGNRKGLPAEPDEASFPVIRSALHDAIHVGVPLPGLEEEYEPHATLAAWLAHYGQKPRRTDCDIKVVPLKDF